MSLFDDLMDLAYDVTCQMLGLPSDTQKLLPLDYKDSPAGIKTPDDDRIFYIVQFGDEQINRQVDNLTVPNADPALTTKRIQYVRNLIINWQTYGSNGFEYADTIRLKLFDPDIQALFEAQGISLITDIPEPFYVPEPYGTQWYKRYDLSAKFNQLVTYTSTVPAVSGTDIIIEDEKGVVSECSVSIQ